MNKAQCLKASNGVVRATPCRTFDDLHTMVISKGYTGALLAGRQWSLTQWRHIESAFHTAQMFRYAAEAKGADRSYWLAMAGKRLGETAQAARER